MIMQDAFTFEESAWERTLQALNEGDTLSAAEFLAVLEGESEEVLEAAFADLNEKRITLDLDSLPDLSGKSEAALRLRREKELVKAGRLYQDLEESDPLKLYLQELAMTPAAGDAELLAQQAAAGSENARNNLMNASLSRVVELAQELAGRGVLLLDLIQEASLGLWECILSWQGQESFESYRDFYIGQSLRKTVTLQARQAGVGQHLRQALEDYRAMDEALLIELGRNATPEEIADRLHITAEEGAVLAGMMEVVATYDRTRPQEEEKPISQEEDMAVEDTAYFQTRQRIAELLTLLSPQEAKLLSLRFGLEGGMPMDPAKAGNALGLTPEEVVAMEAAALNKLRNQEKGSNDYE